MISKKTLKKDYESLISRYDQLEEEKKKLEDKISQLESHQDDRSFMGIFKSSSNAFVELNKKYEKGLLEIARLKEKQLESSTPNQNFYEEIIQSAGNKIEKLTENVTALKYEISRLEEEKQEIKGKLAETIAQVVNLNDFNNKLMTESNDLKQQIKSNEKKLIEIDDSHKVQIINLEKNNMKLSCDLTRSEDEIKKLKAESDKLSKTDHLKLAKAENDLYNLNELLKNAIIEKNAKQAALNEMNVKNEKLQTTFNLLEAERKSVNR